MVVAAERMVSVVIVCLCLNFVCFCQRFQPDDAICSCVLCSSAFYTIRGDHPDGHQRCHTESSCDEAAR